MSSPRQFCGSIAIRTECGSWRQRGGYGLGYCCWIPLVRLHGIDENNASEVAALLAYFRSLQRLLDVSVILVHHTRKNAAGGTAAGLGLRGSSDIHAFGDSNLYLRRGKDHLVLTTEHRAAPASPPIPLALIATNPETTHLEAIAPHQDGRPRSLQDQVLDVLAAGIVLTRAKLRDSPCGQE